MSDRIEVQRLIAADPSTVFALLCDPQGHVAIDARRGYPRGSITKV